MTDQEKMLAICSIIDLCAAASVIIGHNDDLLALEDHPAMRGVKGAISGIGFQAEALLRALEV